MKPKKMSEWQQAAELLAKCNGSIVCGCKLTDEEEEWAPTLYRRCRMLLLAIEDKRRDLIF